MRYIDIRSDTVTQPTPAMRRAMAEAEVGDDVYGDDPTMAELEALAAQMTGKEAALFVPSGTMGNQLAIMTHTSRGDDVLCGRGAHIFVHEVGASAVLSGVTLNPIVSADGILYPQLVAAAIREVDIHCPPSTLLCVENALATGDAVPQAVMEETCDLARSHGMHIHMDGARLFNAAAALDLDAKTLAAPVDSVMFCLSKGLCAPVGSMLAGPADFIARARKNRKLLGGGMRQDGVLAAPGIIALREMTLRLGEDHQNAALLGDLLDQIPGVRVRRQKHPINMVFFTLDAPEEVQLTLQDRLLDRGIKANGRSEGEFRFVTNHDVTPGDLGEVARAMRDILS